MFIIKLQVSPQKKSKPSASRYTFSAVHFIYHLKRAFTLRFMDSFYQFLTTGDTSMLHLTQHHHHWHWQSSSLGNFNNYPPTLFRRTKNAFYSICKLRPTSQ